MSCHGCAEKFGFMKKEHGCPKCGFAYCKKCLRFQSMDPGTKKQLSLCFKCHQSLQATVKKEPMVVINALQRLESMDDPAKPPITVYRQPATRQARLQELKRGLSVEDQQILQRLESLKKDDFENAPTPDGRRKSDNTVKEIAERLARLKDEEYKADTENKTALWRNPTPQTEQDIIAKYSAEVELDSKYEAGVVSDIEERLARLRGESATGGPSSSHSKPSVSSARDIPEDEELSEEDQVKQIMQRLQEEVALDKKTGSDMDVDEVTPESDSNQPILSDDDDDIDADYFCGICSDKRASLRCKECDDDIFCKACFQELHVELGEMHKPTLIKEK